MKSPFVLDQEVGLEFFITDTKGIGGKLRTIVEDFCVEEIPKKIEEDTNGEYTYFILEKKNWETHRAIKAISRALRVSYKRFGFAGTKDKRALSRQWVSAWRIDIKKLEEINIKDIKLYNFKKARGRITLGNAFGNRFMITIRDINLSGEEVDKRLRETSAELTEKGIPNYFGYQRFGIIRPNTHLVGREIVKGNLKEAVINYLGKPCEGEREDAYRARQFLEDTLDFKKALKLFPKRLDYERSMLDALLKNPNDYAGALRRLPKKLRWMLVHAYQSYLFNKILSKIIERGLNIKERKIPLFGYESSFSDGEQGEIEKSVLKEEDVKPGDFLIKSLPELSSKGSLRDACISTSSKFYVGDDEINKQRLKATLEFMLPPGCYATVVLREFMKIDPINY